jgi:CBS domain-containing protein
MIKDPFFANVPDTLYSALVRLSSNEIQEMPVLSSEDSKVVGIVTISDLVTLYDGEVEKIMKIRKGSTVDSEDMGNSSSSRQ